MLTSRGLRVYTRPDGRVFPVDQTAKDVVAILESYLRDANVKVRLNTPVRTILTREGAISGVKLPDLTIDTRAVILATGGSSYPKTGTTGDGWPWARKLGHTIVPIIAALAPIELVREGMDPRAGVALRDIVLVARAGGKKIATWRDDLLFTHRGVSGPTVLGISREVAEHASDVVTLEIDLAPDLKLDTIQAEFLTAKDKDPRQAAARLLENRVPKRLVADVLAASGIDPTQSLQTCTNRHLNKLGMIVKGWPLGTVKQVVLDKGEVVAGGVALHEVDQETMRSSCCRGLYLCGEVLDIAGPVGGYNLQAAFATGYVAGQTAAQDLKLGTQE